MTREEQIDEEAIRVAEHKDDFRFTVQYQYFIQGAEWADKTMIDKACEWLTKGGYFVNNSETIEDFRKAMEE